MHHRHLDAPSGHWSVAVVDSILERGGATDVRALLMELARDPFGSSARAAEGAARHSQAYGYLALVLACLERWRVGVSPH